ncbi:DUF5710 domain-containing protein [Massilia scottii]|uniref:DUF5710 domain-containing protein n=1 Tax=Massilia scottii TaxID=3057166 RepID=UPI00279651B7|nr:DUF5710 domain-containing protein [Massilia sp. CCM 9029]MDQ1835226.1 DUF5710 domain-containing protein [Massilia sp. CCM 9029]
MARIDLNVPFGEKDEAKGLGARWDGSLKLWYIPDGVSSAAFSRWIPAEPDIGLQCDTYFIAETTTNCWRCHERTTVFGFILPAGHASLEEDDDDQDSYAWRQYDEPTIVHYVTDLLPSVASRMKAFSRNYRIDFSKTTESSYWMNHCEHCGMKQGDFGMYCEPEGAFSPISPAGAARITLHEVVEPFGCNGSTGYGDYMFDNMKRA